MKLVWCDRRLKIHDAGLRWRLPIKTGMQPAMMVSLSRRVLAESPGMDKQNVALRMRSMMLLQQFQSL